MHRIGTVLANRYRVDELLAQGAAGSVYRGYRQDMERVVALKVLNTQDANLLARFKREIKTIAKLQHPNVISIFEAAKTDDGKIFYAMEYLAGETLRQIIDRERRLPAQRLLLILQQLAAALGEAHTLGIIHRNLNPDDIMVGQQAGNPDFCTILDFGVARLENADSELTLQGEVLGHPEYFAPEMLGEEDTGPQADVYAVGCMAYECLTGAPPFRTQPRMRAVWMHVRDPVPPFPDDVVRNTPKPLLDLVLWCLEKDPAARPRDGRALSRRLESLELDFAAPGAAPTRAREPQLLGSAPGFNAPPQATPESSHRRPHTPAPADQPRRRLTTPFSNNVVARRPNSRRPLARGELISGDKSCTFVVHHAGSEALGGAALFGASGMDLTVGARLTVSLPTDSRGSAMVRLAGQVQSVEGHPPTLIIQINDYGGDQATYDAMTAKWHALNR